jgi:hypothetical protein
MAHCPDCEFFKDDNLCAPSPSRNTPEEREKYLGNLRCAIGGDIGTDNVCKAFHASGKVYCKFAKECDYYDQQCSGTLRDTTACNLTEKERKWRGVF